MERNQQVAKTIFVQIASYRDQELEETLSNSMETADKPERLRFGLCVQDEQEEIERITAIIHELNYGISCFHFSKSRGVGWARSEAMKHYTGEDFVLQADAHTSFAQGWDELLIEMLNGLDGERAVFSGYPGRYEISSSGLRVCKEGRPNGVLGVWDNRSSVPRCVPAPLDGYRLRSGAVPGLFLSAGFLFAPGAFFQEIPYDPDIFFEGEEASLSLRAFTHGYDVYYPNRMLVWHNYSRLESCRVWNDIDWKCAEQKSIQKVLALFGDQIGLSPFGNGNLRTVDEFLVSAGFAESPRSDPDSVLSHRNGNEQSDEDADKIAFLFLTVGAHNQPAVWERFLDGAEGRYSIYAHTADVERLDGGFLSDSQISTRFHTKWGHISLVEVTLALYEAALGHTSNKRFVLLSESCIPVRPFDEIYSEMFQSEKGRTEFEAASKMALHYPEKAKRFDDVTIEILPEHRYFQSQWTMLPRDLVNVLVRKRFVRAFKNVFAPDENYFLTALSLCGMKIDDLIENRPVTWVQWRKKGDCHPVTHNRLSKKYLSRIIPSGAWFLRKVSRECDCKNLFVAPVRNSASQAIQFERFLIKRTP